MRVLLTGGSGFVGNHLASLLLSKGVSVLSLSRGSTGSRLRTSNSFNSPMFQEMLGDVTTPLNCEVDGIYNLASPASPSQHERDPLQTIRTNVLGSWNLLEFAAERNVPILQASTSDIYGDAEISPQSEDYFGNVNPTGSRASYSESKRLVETLFTEFHRMRGVRGRIARLFSTYGPGMKIGDGRVISNFILNALKSEPLRIQGDGSQVRSFIYVDDVSRGLELMMKSDRPFLGPLNLGNPESVSLLELAHIVKEITGSTSRIETSPSAPPQYKAVVPNIDKALREIAWRPLIGLRDGLEVTVEDFKRRITNFT